MLIRQSGATAALFAGLIFACFHSAVTAARSTISRGPRLFAFANPLPGACGRAINSWRRRRRIPELAREREPDGTMCQLAQRPIARPGRRSPPVAASHTGGSLASDWRRPSWAGIVFVCRRAAGDGRQLQRIDRPPASLVAGVRLEEGPLRKPATASAAACARWPTLAC